LKRIAWIFVLLMPPVTFAYEKRVVHVVEQLRELNGVGPDAVGFAGTPHDFLPAVSLLLVV